MEQKPADKCCNGQKWRVYIPVAGGILKFIAATGFMPGRAMIMTNFKIGGSNKNPLYNK
jgi:hypothetical protein